ncbi:MAG: tetratricopeptide repeat protein [Gemmataceae bacterium]
MMKNHILVASFLAVLLSWVGGSTALAQDQVIFYDRTKRIETTASGKITGEDSSAVTVQGTLGARKIPAIDIIDVVYTVRPALGPDYRRARTAEQNVAKDPQADPQEVIDLYKSLRGELLKEMQQNAVRHMDFKIASMMIVKAQRGAANVADAATAMDLFIKDNPGAWQVISGGKQLASLYLAQDQFEKAQQMYDELAKMPALDKDTQLEFQLQAALMLTKAQKFADAEKRLQSLLQIIPANSPQAMRVQVYLAQCLAGTKKFDEAEQKLKTLIDKVTDPQLRALAMNTLGDCYLVSDRKRDALWQYLWVDVIYNQDRQERLKAVRNLAALFDEFGEETRAQRYKELLKEMSK